MISSESEYRQALDELAYLTDWLARLENDAPSERKLLTISSVRMMISRVQQEVAAYEIGSALKPNQSPEIRADNANS